jgi:hypothetical protein
MKKIVELIKNPVISPGLLPFVPSAPGRKIYKGFPFDFFNTISNFYLVKIYFIKLFLKLVSTHSSFLSLGIKN